MSARSKMFRARLVAIGVLASAPALALPKVGDPRPPARVVDADDRGVDLHAFRGRPILVIYEDKDSATLNAPLKNELARLARGDRYKNAVALVPVANVASYDYWPVRGFVKDAIKDESKKIGATIYCDWDGSFRRSLGLAGNTSSVVLVGRDGRVLFAQEGFVQKEQRDQLLGLLRGEVEGR